MPDARISSAGLMLYLDISASESARMAAEIHDGSMVFPIMRTDATIIPMTAAWMPLSMALMAVDFLRAGTNCDRETVRTAGGVNMAIVAQMAPVIPVSLYPMKVAEMKIGPGVI